MTRSGHLLGWALASRIRCNTAGRASALSNTLESGKACGWLSGGREVASQLELRRKLECNGTVPGAASSMPALRGATTAEPPPSQDCELGVACRTSRLGRYLWITDHPGYCTKRRHSLPHLPPARTPQGQRYSQPHFTDEQTGAGAFRICTQSHIMSWLDPHVSYCKLPTKNLVGEWRPGTVEDKGWEGRENVPMRSSSLGQSRGPQSEEGLAALLMAASRHQLAPEASCSRA